MKTSGNILRSHGRRAMLALVSLTALTFGSCADDDVTSGTDGDKGANVSFNVSQAQDNAQAAAKGMPVTRASFTNELALQGLTPADLPSQKIEAQGMSGACLIETTTAGIDNNALHAPAATRANIKGEGTNIFAASDHFATIGYRGATAVSVATIASKPWFHDADTKADGVLVNAVPWRWAQPYGKFFGIYPRPADYSKLTLSPSTSTSRPYIDFEVEQNVTNQKDFMTACSGTVQYATRFVAPTTNLQFRHALTAVRFKVGQNLSWNKTITKIEIVGAKSKGRYTPSTEADGTGAAWSSLSNPTTFTLDGLSVSTSDAVNNVIVGKNNDNYTFYMIPQQLSGAGVQVKVYFGGSTPAITATLTGTWKPGTTKVYALSQNTSDWSYVLTSTSPAAVAYDQTASGNYTIQSYRKDPVTHVQQPVKWEVVGYDADGDNTFSMAEKPAWLTSLSKTEGDGGTSADQGTATLTKDVTDLLAKRNKTLKETTITSSASAPYDLSLHDHNGNTTLRNTANSYLISAPGHYRIPLVYGNAIENGATNANSYISHAPTGNSDVLYNFQDHAGHNIDNPWIEKTNGGANASVDGAEVVWADAANLVSSLSIKHVGGDAFLDFEVKASDIQSGNAVVAVTKGSGASKTVLWSWHLWFAPKDALDKIPVTNYQGKVYNFTKEALGWKPTQWSSTTYTSARTVKVKVEQTVANNGTKAYTVINITQNPGRGKQGATTLYQFGRKDAFPGVATSDLKAGGITENAGDNMSIMNGILNPDKFYIWGSNWNSNYGYYNLWSADNTVTGGYNQGNDNPVVKTVYDPCPAGFKMPANNAFTGFTTTGQNSSTQSELNVDGTSDLQQWTNNFGHNFWTSSSKTATIYFPTSGFRNSSGGLLSLVGSNGYYWSAVPGSSYNGCGLYFTSDYVYPLNYDTRTCGFSARPVSE